MNSPLDYIVKNPKETKRLLGIDYEQLQQLIAIAELRHNQKQEEIEKKKIRIIKKGGGRKPQLEVTEQILLTLVYLRHSPTFQLLGWQFGVSESTANEIFHYWQEIFREILPSSLLEQVKKCGSDCSWVREILTELKLIVDSSEQVRERPKEYEEQKKFYSGKKKNHTLKNQFIVLPKGKDIVDVLPGEPGPSSDINLFRERQEEFADNQKFSGDKAYKGEPQISTPHKQPKKGKLTTAQQQENKELSRERIGVEHLIRLVKIFKIAQERFRLLPQMYESVIFVVCGLIRLRIKALILQ